MTKPATLPCAGCGDAISQTPGPGRIKLWCSPKCRAANHQPDLAHARAREYPKNATCAACGKPIYVGRGSLPRGEATCRACRAERRRSTCERCGAPFVRKDNTRGRFCSLACANAKNTEPLDPHWRRLAAAPGLKPWQLRALRRQWRAEGRRCSYCTEPAATIDHVVPLSRGGTNEMANLAPACVHCNASKRDRTPAEWADATRVA